MLVTNPAARAPLSEVLNHPWMQRGYRGPPDSHLVHREPLRAEDLDRNVIRGMKGFEFGSEDEIERKLIEVLESDAYFRAVQHWERKRSMANGRNKWSESMSNSSLAVSFDGTTLASSSPANGSRYDHNSVTSSPSKKSRRFSGFDFSSYRKKLFSPSSSPPTTPMHSPPTSQSHLSHSSLTDASQREPADPTYGFHPLISIYFLAREKLERERVYGPGHFASSQLSLESRADPSTNEPPSAPAPTAKNLSQPVIPKNNGVTPAKPDYSMPLPRLPAPETSHYSGMSYEPAAATPSPTAAHFPQPRARDPALTNLTVPKREMSDAHSVPSSPVKANMTGLPRAPQASAHKRSHSLSQRPSVSRGWAGMFGGVPTPNPVQETEENGTIRGHRKELMEPPRTAGPELSAFAQQMERSQQEQEQLQHDDSYRLPMPMSAGATLVRKFGSLLGGGKEGSVRHSTAKRGSIFTGGFSPRPSGEVLDSEKKSQHTLHNGEVDEKENEEAIPPTPQITTEAPTPTSSPGAIAHSQSQPITNTHRRAATIMDPASRAVRHERRSSTGAAFFSNVGGTIGRHRRPSTGGYGYTQPRGSTGERAFGRTEEVDEQGEAQEQDAEGEHGIMSNGADKETKVAGDHSGDEKEFKPVFLKGLFR